MGDGAWREIRALERSAPARQLLCNVNIVSGNLKSENSQDYAQKPPRNCTFMNSASGDVTMRPRMCCPWPFFGITYMSRGRCNAKSCCDYPPPVCCPGWGHISQGRIVLGSYGVIADNI